MKLLKDTWIEGSLFKKGTDFQIIEKSSFDYRYLNDYETIPPTSRTFDKNNFYKDTEAIFIRSKEPNYPPDYVSDSGSKYWYMKDGVYRRSDHWGRNVASCNWYLFGQKGQNISSWDYKGPEITGFAKWVDFRDLIVKRSEKYFIPSFIKRAKSLEETVERTLGGEKTKLTKKTAILAKKNSIAYGGYVFLYKDRDKNFIAEISPVSGKPNIQVEVYKKITN